MEQTKTKKALIMSVLSMVLCIAMLIGMTFAWFTDTASTGVNKIQAGTLDVDLEYATAWDDNGNPTAWESTRDKNTNKDKIIDFVKAKGHENEAVLWEPGCTYKLPELRVVNKGNLALKYNLVISGAKDATGVEGKDGMKLLDVIKFTSEFNGAETTISNGSTIVENRSLLAKEGNNVSADVLKISAKMDESAGNEYQGLSLEGITITVYATQLNYESDSIGPDYDAAAGYTRTVEIATAEGFAAAVKNAWQGDTIKLTGDITLSSAASIGKNIDIDLNGNTLGSTASNTIKLTAGAKVTVKNGTITNEYSGRQNATTVDLVGAGAEFTLLSGTVESNSKDNLYSVAIGNSKKKACTVNIAGGTVKNPDGHVKSRAINASNGMTLNISGGKINGGLYGVDVYDGSVTNITGGNISANAEDGRTDEYGKSYAIHAKGEANITVGSLKSESTPEVKGIKFESNGPVTNLPTINLIKGNITNPIYSMETKYNYKLFKLGIVAGAPVTFTDNTANYFLPDDLKMVKVGDIWKVTAK